MELVHAATSEALHEFTTFNANRSVSQMATEMCDTALLTKLAEGDLVAIEAKYHFNCLSRYRNQYRGYLRAKADSSRSLQLADKKAKARAFAELISYIETALEEDTHIFKLSELHTVYLERLQNFGLSLSVNKTRLKDDIIEIMVSKNSLAEQKLFLFSLKVCGSCA